MPVLNTASSIIDFYKSKGFRPSAGEPVPLFSQRKKDFERLGLSSQLGDFRGSAEQNTALLNALVKGERNTGVSITPQNIDSIVRVAQQHPIQQATTTQQRPPLRLPSGQTISPADPQYEEFLRSGGKPEPVQAPPGSIEEITAPPQITPPQITQPQQQQIPQEIQQRISEITKTPTAEDITGLAQERFFGRPTFPLEQESIEAEKERVRLGAQQEKESIISSLASRGLFFSGKKTKGIESIEAQKLSDLLGIDRKFAIFITQGLETAAQQVAKEAQAGSKTALDALEKLGFTINPITGGVEPTLEARKAQQQAQQQQLQAEQFQQTQQRLEGQAQAQQQRFEVTQALAEARLAVSMAQNQAQMAIAQRRLELAEANASKVGVGVSDLNRQLKELQIQQAEQSLSTGTQAQGLTAGYAERIQQSNRILTQLETKINKYSAVGYAIQRALPNWAPGKDPNIQSQEQAERNFINSVLRRESGAVISPQEFDNAKKQYFIQPGDSKKVLAQKKANRQLVEKSFIKSSGRAFTPVQTQTTDTFNDIWK